MPGAVLKLEPDQWRYHDGTRAVLVRVAGARLDISGWYDGAWVWIEAHEMEFPDREPPGHRMQLLVRCDALPADLCESRPGRAVS